MFFSLKMTLVVKVFPDVDGSNGFLTPVCKRRTLRSDNISN